MSFVVRSSGRFPFVPKVWVGFLRVEHEVHIRSIPSANYGIETVNLVFIQKRDVLRLSFRLERRINRPNENVIQQHIVIANGDR